MRLAAKTLLLSMIAGATAGHAGMRDPAGMAGEGSLDLRALAAPPSPRPAAKPVRAATAAVYGPAPPPGYVPPKNAARSPASRRLSPELDLPTSFRNRGEILRFSQQARKMRLPAHREIPTTPRAAAIYERYAAALNPRPYRPIRTPLQMQTAATTPIRLPPPPWQYEHIVQRLDALFAGLDHQYAAAMASLWDLQGKKEAVRRQQARDALFAGIFSLRAGWPALAGNLMSAAVSKGIIRSERHREILWSQLDFLPLGHAARVVKLVPFRDMRTIPPGDLGNFLFAKDRLTKASEKEYLSFVAAIRSVELRERLELLRALKRAEPPTPHLNEATATLTRLEAEGVPGVREEARLALARLRMKGGETSAALELYRAVPRNGSNRLELLGEQSFAELRAGLYQESLGKAVGLQSPYFAYGFAPDVHMIEVLSRKSLCDFGGAEAGIRRFRATYEPELSGLRSLPKDSEHFYETLIAYHAIPHPLRFQRFLLRLPVVMENQKLLRESNSELKLVSALAPGKAPSGWDSFTTAMQKSWESHARKLKRESGRAARAEATYMEKRLANSFSQSDLLALDVATGATKDFHLQSAMNFPVRKPASDQIPDDRFHWPFELEIWEDELDYLKMKNPSKCANRELAQNPLKPSELPTESK